MGALGSCVGVSPLLLPLLPSPVVSSLIGTIKANGSEANDPAVAITAIPTPRWRENPHGEIPHADIAHKQKTAVVAAASAFVQQHPPCVCPSRDRLCVLALIHHSVSFLYLLLRKMGAFSASFFFVLVFLVVLRGATRDCGPIEKVEAGC